MALLSSNSEAAKNAKVKLTEALIETRIEFSLLPEKMGAFLREDDPVILSEQIGPQLRWSLKRLDLLVAEIISSGRTLGSRFTPIAAATRERSTQSENTEATCEDR